MPETRFTTSKALFRAWQAEQEFYYRLMYMMTVATLESVARGGGEEMEKRLRNRRTGRVRSRKPEEMIKSNFAWNAEEDIGYLVSQMQSSCHLQCTKCMNIHKRGKFPLDI